MPRRTRTRYERKLSAWEQAERERECAELETELHQQRQHALDGELVEEAAAPDAGDAPGGARVG